MSDKMSNEDKAGTYSLDHLISHDSEYDDALCVPDSLEITLNENENVGNTENTESADIIGKIANTSFFPLIYVLPINVFNVQNMLIKHPCVSLR